MRKYKKPKSNLCRWNCGRETKNHSGICDNCWREAATLRSNTSEGQKAWLERKKAQQQAKVKRPMSKNHREALVAARRGKLLKDSLAKGLLGSQEARPYGSVK
jgi:hypothetical protein